jgi:TPR repeat protein
MSLPPAPSRVGDLATVEHNDGRSNPPSHPFIASLESHPALPLARPDPEFIAELTALPLYCLASRVSVQRWDTMFCGRASSPAPPQQWNVFGICVGLQQRRALLTRGGLCELLVLRLMCFRGEYRVRRPLHAAACILSQRHFLVSRDRAERLYREGQQLHAQQRYGDAAKSWAQAALLQHAPSHAYLSNMLIEGRHDVEKDHRRAFELASAGAAMGCAHSIGVLSQCYVTGVGVSKHVAKGLVLARDSAAGGSCFGQFVMGMLHHVGWEVVQDYNEAGRMYQAAAAQGHAVAQCNLGCMFDHDQLHAGDSGAEAVRLWRLAAAQGHAGAQFNLGALFETGRRVPRDTAEAARWYRLAAATGVDGEVTELAAIGLRRLGL